MGRSNDTHTQLCVCVCVHACMHICIFLCMCVLSLAFSFPSPLCSSVSSSPFLLPSLLFFPSLPSSTPILTEVNFLDAWLPTWGWRQIVGVVLSDPTTLVKRHFVPAFSSPEVIAFPQSGRASHHYHLAGQNTNNLLFLLSDRPVSWGTIIGIGSFRRTAWWCLSSISA